MTLGAPLTVLDDGTELNGPDLDVAVRIGWVVRMARLTTGEHALTLEKLARKIGTSAARLHRLETGRLRDGALLDAVEVCLDRPVGSLRAPVDIICRTFPSSPRDRDAATRLVTVRDVSAATERVSGDNPTGGDWLVWARALSRPGAVGMPESIGLTQMTRLVSELNRATGNGYPTRYEALALLRCSDYGHLVLEVAREAVADQHVQVLFDMMSAVGEAITPDAVAWCLELLDDSRDRVAIGGALALENMGQISGDPTFWRELVAPIATRFNEFEPGTTQWEWLSHLLRLVPRAELARAKVRPRAALAPAATVENWSRSRVNRHWSDCERRAKRVTQSAGVPDQPMLSRLLFDIAISPYESRGVTSYMLLGALPTLAVSLGDELAEIAEHHEDPVIRARAGRRLSGALHGGSLDVAVRWIENGGPADRDRGLMLAGAAGLRLDETSLRTAVADGAHSAHSALYAAGMVGHTLLLALVADGQSDDVRGAAAWWLRQGARVADEARCSAPGAQEHVPGL